MAPALVAWLVGALTLVAACTADGAWQQLDDDAWQGAFRLQDMMGLATLTLAVLFGIGGWVLRRQAVIAAPLVLGAAGWSRTLEATPAAGIWWTGSAIALAWALAQVVPSVRQLLALRALALTRGTSRPVDLTPDAREAVRRGRRRPAIRAVVLTLAAMGAGVLTAVVLQDELGRTYAGPETGSISDFIAVGAAVMGILALGQWLTLAWGVTSTAAIGNVVWLAPASGGPLLDVGHDLPGAGGTLPLNAARSDPGCACLEEALRAEPDAGEDVYEDAGVPAAPSCPAHGIDRVNAMTPQQFRATASSPWLWDERSPIPGSGASAGGRVPLIGFTGHAFTGFTGRLQDGRVDLGPLGPLPLEERHLGEEDDPAESPRPPRRGVLDRIDLRPAAIPGEAVRYRHGRAWYEAEGTWAGNPDHRPGSFQPNTVP